MSVSGNLFTKTVELIKYNPFYTHCGMYFCVCIYVYINMEMNIDMDMDIYLYI